MQNLPAAFDHLDDYLDRWALPDSRARQAARLEAGFDELQAFYDAMLPCAPAALEHLSAFPLGELPQAEENLLKLMLALAEIGPAVEWYGQPQVIDGFPAHRFRLVEQLSDTAPQE